MLSQRHQKLAFPDLHGSGLLNQLHTGVGLLRSETHKWAMTLSAVCKCGAKEQIAEHGITSCPIYHHPNRFHDLSDIDKNLVAWLMETYPAMQWTIQFPFISSKRRRKMITNVLSSCIFLYKNSST